MKTLLNILLSFCLLQNSFCQVSGKLVTAGNQPIPFANVLLLKNDDSTLVKAVLTNEKGDYQMENIVRGKYFLRYSSVGYQNLESQTFDLTDTGQEKDFGTIVMKEDDKQLDEVVVRAQKPLFSQQPEGTIISVESSIFTKGSSALQVLERSPGVMLDYRNNSIALNGKSGVMVMINGKLLRMTMEQVVSLLNGMSADDIEKIELLTTPPAKYDADGNAGLINIVLKKNKKLGTNATGSLTAGYGWREKATASINLSHNTGNINSYGSYAFSHNRTYTDLDITSAQHMPFLGGDVSVRYWDTARFVNNSHDATIGIDIKLNAKTTIGASMNYNNSVSSGSRVTHAGYNVLLDSLIVYDGVNSGANRWKNLMSSVYLEKQINEKEKIIFDFDYLYYKNEGNSEVQSSFINKHGAQAGGENLFARGQILA
jgi:iron complex outermembrane receptor protein